MKGVTKTRRQHVSSINRNKVELNLDHDSNYRTEKEIRHKSIKKEKPYYRLPGYHDRQVLKRAGRLVATNHMP